MANIWAPWRMEYVTDPEKEGCFLCAALEKPEEPASLIVELRERVFIIMNKYPYTGGHLMVAPKRHIREFSELSGEELTDVMTAARDSVEILSRVMKPHGFNLGFNLGRVAGAGLVDHIHLHVVPRWEGDTNFMPGLAGPTVVPEALEETRRKLREEFGRGARRAEQP